MNWKKPKATPVTMNAEIGAYQDDWGGEYPPFIAGHEPTRSGSTADANEKLAPVSRGPDSAAV